MKQNVKSIIVAGRALTLGSLLMAGMPAGAQQQPAPPPPPGTVAAQPGTGGAAATNARTRSLESVLAGIGKGAGVTIVADSTVAAAQVVPPAEASTAANFTQQVEALVQSLGRGATWAKLYLPAPSGSRGYRGDDVSGYATAQARLFGPVGGATPAGTVEIMGQKVPFERADAVVAALNLRPVYLVTNPSAQPAGGDLAASWETMTEEQRRAYSAQQAQQLLNASPEARRKAMQGMMMQGMMMREMFRNMSPEQRQQFGQEMGGFFGGRRGGDDRGDRGRRPNR